MIPKKSLDSVLDQSIILTKTAPNDNAKSISVQCGGVDHPLTPWSNGPALAVAVKQIASGSEMSHEEEEQSRLQPFVRCL